ncbi:6-carboxyhexanoate--CoA ligase [Veillonella criceti]|uniref:6-carboxyhexanoate--CoA ligase n=1 Tax=Veillonella criceti TaxID=103891 RepID=A0A380NKZ3_9FIRM|nr:6-carboxyhexanoate--CoA ligase [Veillonella criceti]SUP43256.1 6-carboxyhexanoate--CoA ligase [Veillonella criceti]
MYYSIRMRAAQGGAHEKGGHHISGAERIVTKDQLEQLSAELVHRALHHSKGCADFIRLTIDAIDETGIHYVPALSVKTTHATSVEAAYAIAQKLLTTHGVTETALQQGLHLLRTQKEAMRGALICNALTGDRMDNLGNRGLRVSRMAFANENKACQYFQEQGHTGIHFQEALVLATKVLSAPQVISEFCISDDPDYTTGYVSYGHTYHRLGPLKEFGDERGGRIFFVQPNMSIDDLQNYLENTTVLVTTPNNTPNTLMASNR